MDESQKYAEQKNVLESTYCLHLYELLEESKPMYSDINQISDCLRERGKTVTKEFFLE